MIKNERQYRITKAQLAKLEAALARLDGGEPADGVHPLLVKAQRDALRSQVDELRDELREYEALRSGSIPAFEIRSFSELPHMLVRARIASGLSQKDLADRLGLKEQQIQRYEATEYASASLERLREVVDALGLRMCDDVYLPDERIAPQFLLKRLEQAGLPRDLVQRRIVPHAWTGQPSWDAPGVTVEANNLAIRSAEVVGRVFDLSPSVLFGPEPLQLGSEAAGLARFKVASNAELRRLRAYTSYAHYLARLVLRATPDLPRRGIPTRADEASKEIIASAGAVTFVGALEYAWSLGVPVLPLADAGAFHGACWRVGGRNVIAIKQSIRYAARWTHDLLHELRHAGQAPERDELVVIEVEETSDERRKSAEELEANRFAGDVMLDGRAEELADLCVKAARGGVERLKSATPRVAAQAGVPVDYLANYMAYRLSLQGINWWGAAANLQPGAGDPWAIARDVLLERLDVGRLDDVDRGLLLRAMTANES